MVTFFRGPRSYTGEDVVEVALYGNPVLEEAFLRRLGEAGVLPALPGEFTFRAVLHGKMDLVRAEGLAALIEARTPLQVERALDAAEGAFSARLGELKERLAGALALVQAAVEFPEEELETGDDRVARAFGELAGAAESLVASCRPVPEGGLPAVALAGPPNAGKSTLFNRLAGGEKALVTPAPGTTRDGLRETVALGACRLSLMDSAGIFEADDAVTAQAVARALAQVEGADRVLWLADASRPRGGQAPAALAEKLGGRLAVAANKADLGVHPDWADGAVPLFSALTGDGMERIEALLAGWAAEAEREGREAAYFVTWRQERALADLSQRLQRARRLAGEGALELAAQEALDGAAVLADLTGEIPAEAVLDKILSSFCIGK
jgi:tRNA modification GTPase